MAREKQVAIKSLFPPTPESSESDEEEDEIVMIDASPSAVQSLLKKAPITQLVDLGDPEMSELTAKFAIGSKFYSYVYPGKGGAHLGHAPANPPLRSPLYTTYPELIGVRYAAKLRELELLKPGISRRWKMVRITPR